MFVDNLVFPRFVTPFGPNAILTKESNAQEVWKYTDTNGDGVADKKELFDTGYGRLGNIEGQEAFLTWTLDNWMYSTYNAFRARWTPHGVIKEPTGSNGGEWGVTQDNDGKIWFESGAPGVPSDFSSRSSTATSTSPDQFEPDFRIPWGAPVRIADMQGGMARHADAGRVAEERDGQRRQRHLPRPPPAQGRSSASYFYGEPVARIVRRIHPENKEGLTHPPQRVSGQRVHQVARPVLPAGGHHDRAGRHDLHHRHVPRHHPGRELHRARHLPARARSSSTHLDKVIHKGRIWRLVYDGVKPDRSDRAAARSDACRG